jgi:hypothetical protein
MSEELGNIALEAGELLRYAMDPHESPFQNKRYSTLMSQLYTSGTFKLIFENIVQGLEVQILAYSPHGVFVAGRDRGPFAFKMDDYKSGMRVEERVVHGLLMLAIAAYCFPAVEVLDQDDEILRPRFTVEQVAAFVQGLCKICKANSPGDPQHGTPEMKLAWETILGLPLSMNTGQGKMAMGSLAGKIQYALDRLTDNGLMRFLNSDGWGTFQPTPAYRIQVKQMAGHQMLKLVQSIQQAAPVTQENNSNG